MNKEKKTILLVEDEALIALSESEILKKFNFNVIIANDSKQAIDTVKQNHDIDLILMDIELGNEPDGTETAKQILSEFNLPIVFLSSHTEEEIVVKAEKITSYGYIIKNSSTRVLVASINMAFRLFEANEEIRESEYYMNEAQKKAKIGSFYWDVTTGDVACSQEMLRIWGYPSDRKFLTLDEVFSRIHPEDKSYVSEKLNAAVKNESNYDAKFRILLPDNKVYYIHGTGIYDKKDPRKRPIMLGTGQDITDDKLAEERIHSLLKEKELLLKEVHHRVKNDMNIVRSILSLQASQSENDNDAGSLLEAKNRVSIMFNVYNALYKESSFIKINLKYFLEELIQNIQSIYEAYSNVSVEKNIDDIDIGRKMLFPIGIIINELINNAYKHAFRTSEKGTIDIDVTTSESRIDITVRDNGKGMMLGNDDVNHDTFGYELINALIDQYDGSLKIKNDRGTEILISLEMIE